MRIDDPGLPGADPTPHREPAQRSVVRECFPCPPLRAGTAIAEGRYLVNRVVGTGAFGTVYEVMRRDGALRALKVPHEEVARSERGRERFAREIELAARVRHAHLAAVDDRGVLADGRPFMAMELVRGESVAERLARGVFSVEEALAVADAVLAALAALADRGIVHRDVKPANVLLSSRGGALRAVLVDFGTATLRERAPRGAARHGTSLIGTPDYMAPEQFDGRPVDARTDVYGAGALLFELLTGRAPRCELGSDGWRGERIAVRALQQGWSAALDATLARALAPDPALRFANAAAFRRALTASRRPRLRALRPLLAVPALAAAAYVLAPWVAETRGASAQPAPVGEVEADAGARVLAREGARPEVPRVSSRDDEPGAVSHVGPLLGSTAP